MAHGPMGQCVHFGFMIGLLKFGIFTHRRVKIIDFLSVPVKLDRASPGPFESKHEPIVHFLLHFMTKRSGDGLKWLQSRFFWPVGASFSIGRYRFDIIFLGI